MSSHQDDERTNPPAASALKDLLDKAAARVRKRNVDAHRDEDAKFQERCRKNLVADMALRADVLGSKTKLFISYSQVASKFHKIAREHFEASGDFEVKTWQDDKPNRKRGITEDIIQRIGACSCFLGIWSGTYSTIKPEGEPPILDVPKVWMPVELGIARAKGAICSVLVHDDVHSEFHREANLGEYNDRFNEQNLRSQLKKVEQDFRLALKVRSPRWRQESPLDVDYSKWSDAEYWPPLARPASEAPQIEEA